MTGAAFVAFAFLSPNCQPSGGTYSGDNGTGGSGGNNGDGGNNGNGGSSSSSNGGSNGNGGSQGNGGSNNNGGSSSKGGSNSNGGSNNNGGSQNNGGSNSNGGSSTSNGGTPSNGGSTTSSTSSTPTGTTVTFASGKAQGAMVGYGWVASGSSDPITDPTCGATKATISTATPCAADPNWSSPSSLCVSGTIPALGTPPDYTANYGIVVGVNANDPSGTLGTAFTSMTMAASGLPTGTVRAQVHVKGDPDSTSYCMTYSASAMTLAKFATDCYNPTPLLLIPAASIANIDKVSLEAVSGAAAVTVASMCITGITFAK